MNSILEFARGPLFRLCFALMILGLARILFLDVWGAYKALKRAGDKKIPWKLILSRSWEWIFPLKRMKNNFHFYSLLSILFHVGLIIVPVFLFAHVQLWKISVGIFWPSLPFNWALILTVSTIVFAFLMLLGRIIIKPIKELSKGQDYLWLLLLLVPFTTGFICVNFSISPGTYQLLMFFHVLSADVIFLLIPFSKIAHCVLVPLSQIISGLAWKFPPRTDDDICTTLNKKGAPV